MDKIMVTTKMLKKLINEKNILELGIFLMNITALILPRLLHH